MARTRLFARLRRLAQLTHEARAAGCADPQAISAFVRTHSRRAFTQRVILGAAAAAVAGCGDGDGNDGGGSSGSAGSSGGSGSATGSGSGSSGGAEGSSSSGGADSSSGGDTPVRVAIIGGGMAGLHCAHRLREVGVDATVYEASDRTGGRMFTARGMFADEQVAELGGEFIDSVHQTLFDLADEFAIELDDREDSFDATTLRDTWYVGGVAVPDATVVAQFSEVAATIADQVTMADEDDAAYDMLDNTPLSQWLDDVVPAADYPELHAILASAYRGEYGLENDEQSALNLIYLIGSDTPDEFHIFGISDERFHTHLGNDTFTTALAAALEGHVLTGKVLTTAADRDGGGFVLGFADGESVECEHVVFALPFTKLREVDLDGLTLSADKRTIIDELGYGTNAKVMGGFTERVWRTQHSASGSVTTDLAAQQFWDTSVGQAGSSAIATNFLGGDQGVASGGGTAEEWFVEVALNDLETIFPGSAAAYVPSSAVRMHWPTHPHTLGSYACYRPGQWAFYGLEGAREGNVHFCGEHTSLEFQGFMEGAAETGLLVATAILDDLGIMASPRAREMAARKLQLPHPAVHGRPSTRPRWAQRQRVLVRPAAAALARRR
ncbi:MAG: FAD-dependent oxidoreductase [Deltaproteobacteria bacterium]|nr:FAD-dependent oxidoreductase [Deltaproteobacteria bacterium]